MRGPTRTAIQVNAVMPTTMPTTNPTTTPTVTGSRSGDVHFGIGVESDTGIGEREERHVTVGPPQPAGRGPRRSLEVVAKECSLDARATGRFGAPPVRSRRRRTGYQRLDPRRGGLDAAGRGEAPSQVIAPLGLLISEVRAAPVVARRAVRSSGRPASNTGLPKNEVHSAFRKNTHRQSL